MIHETIGHLAVPIKDLKPYRLNPRVGNVDAIADSLKINGQYRPVVANRRTAEVLAGNHTLKAAIALGWDDIAVTWVDVDDVGAAKIVAVDNRANDLASYDDVALVELLKSLPELDGTLYSATDLDALVAALSDVEAPDLMESAPSSIPSLPEDAITKPGDIWLLGEHRVICGDCRDHETVVKLMNGRAANVAFTSPPYADRRVYDTDSGFTPISPDEYVEWFAPVALNVKSVMAPDGSWFVNIKPGVTPDGMDTEPYCLDLVLAHVRYWGWHWATEFCWERNGVPKNVTRRFKNQFEPVYQFALNRWKMRPESVQHHSENVPIAGGPGVGNTSRESDQGTKPVFGKARKRKNGTSQMMSDVQGTTAAPGEYIAPGMAYPGNRLPTFAGSHEALGHTAAFPVGLPQWFIRAYSDEGDAIFDPFMGSGSTLIAAHNEKRIAFGSEISPKYTDVICRRYQELTGEMPILESTKEPHDFTKDGE